MNPKQNDLTGRFYAMGACAGSETSIYEYNDDIPAWFTRAIIDCMEKEEDVTIPLMVRYGTKYITDRFTNRDKISFSDAISLYAWYIQNKGKYPNGFDAEFDRIYDDYFLKHDISELINATYAPVWYCPDTTFSIRPE